MESAMMLFKMN